MHDIIERFTKYSHWLVFIVLEIASVSILLGFNSYQGSIWFTTANTAVGKVLEWESDVTSFVNLREENKDLTKRYLLLQRRLEVMEKRLADLEHDSSYTERLLAEQLRNVQLVPARVVDCSITKQDNFMTIDLGSKDGIREEMGVVCGTGIVGIVSKVGPHYSIVQTILNSHSSISCRLRGTNYFGYLRWSGGNCLTASLEDIPRHARFKIGDAVETSGFSNVFPAGIFVGKIVKIHDSNDGLSYSLLIQLSTDIAKVRDVMVCKSTIEAPDPQPLSP